jgi:GT2 family glycosyltransferase
LNSIFRSAVNFDFEVFVVDNASSDGSAAMLRRQFPQVHLIANKENVGFAKANNQAIIMSDAEYVLLLNPDTILQEDTLQKCVTQMDGDATIGALGITMYDGNGNFLPESKRGFPSPKAAFAKMTGLAALFPKSKTFGKYHLGYLDKNQNHEVDVLSGAFMLLRRTVLDKVGRLDETYFMYGEDVDLSYRIQQAGYKNLYFSQSNIIHFKGESTKKGNLNYIKLFYGAMIIFTAKQLSQTEAKLFIPVLKSAIYAKALMEIIRQFIKKTAYPIMDAGIIIANIFILKYIFENYIKYKEHLTYPATFLYVNLPIYTAIWLISLWLSGAYTQFAKWKHIIAGLLLGFVGISVVYSFLPLSLRSSRGIIVLAMVFNTIGLLSYRWIFTKLFRTENNFFKIKHKYVLVCGGGEVENLKTRLEKVQQNSRFAGFVHPAPPPPQRGISPNENHFLGRPEQLNEIVQVHGITQIFFSTDTLPMQTIVESMRTVKTPVQFKMITKQTIISSNNKNTKGEIISIDVSAKNDGSWLQKIREWVMR